MIKTINRFEEINETLTNNSNFIRDGYGHMWKIENNKLFYKPQGINNFFEVKIKGNWFVDLIE